VIWATSFTKTVAPGLRVGYLVLPPELATADIPEAVQRLAAAVDAARLSQAATAGA
jgi:DNA-binding transcriptional MocR family regulator